MPLATENDLSHDSAGERVGDRRWSVMVVVMVVLVVI